MESFNKKEALKTMLMDASLTSDWIDATAKVFETFKVSDHSILDFKAFTGTQVGMMIELARYLDNDIDKTFVWMQQMPYNDTQLQLILKVLKAGVPIEKLYNLVDPSVPYAVMNYIFAGIVDGYNQLEDPKYLEYDQDQLCEIYSGLKDGIDISLFDNKSIPSEKMAIIRHAITIGLKVEIGDENKLTIY